MIGLLGATGYTGRLTAAVLAAAGIPHRLGGRSPERLKALPATAHGDTVVVDTTKPGDLDAFLDGCTAVISTVGPFEQLGRPVVDAAVRNQVPYVDSTGELGFMRWVYETHRHAPVTLVPACGFDYIPGDLAASLAADEVGGPEAVTDVLIGYRMGGTGGGGVTRGTARSAIGIIGSTQLSIARTQIPFLDGARSGIVVPWGEAITVPLLCPNAKVRTAIAAPAAAALVAGLAAPLVKHSGPLVRAVTPVLAKRVEKMPEGPSDEVRAQARFTVVAVVTGKDGRTARVEVEGTDAYKLTGELLVACAQRLGDAPPGARTTAEAFDAADVLDAIGKDRITWKRG